ncbi:MAG: sigma-70 family RNA polymerase sigma factor [Alphaproteobacteria bacterium]|nr:sigma-70 family RNA polymerase sigma factor [Alphaproteobacteria bacterium]
MSDKLALRSSSIVLGLVTQKELLKMFDNNALIEEMGRLGKFARRLTGNTCDAEDLLQSTVLRAMEKKHLFQEDSNLFSWSSKIMFNIFVSGYRRKVKFETQYDPETVIGNEAVAPAQEIKMTFKDVESAMGRISNDHREVLMMVCVNGMEYTAASAALGIPIGTVRSRLSRARESLQTELDAGRYAGAVAVPLPHEISAQRLSA